MLWFLKAISIESSLLINKIKFSKEYYSGLKSISKNKNRKPQATSHSPNANRKIMIHNEFNSFQKGTVAK